MNTTVNIAVIGATGAVGEAMLAILQSREFPAGQVSAVASGRSAGMLVEYGADNIEVQDLTVFDFADVDIALFSAGASVSGEHAPRAAAAGCVVVDNTSRFRYQADIPLVVPEVNADKIGEFRNHGIIANPNCSTIQMVVALKPIYDAVGIERINVATYQAVSGTGKKGIAELEAQTAALLNGKTIDTDVYPKQIGFNVLPHIDVFQDNGYTREEMKLVWETQKIIGDENILVNATAVRVPVFFGHSEAVHVETRDKITASEVRGLLAAAPGVTVLDEPVADSYPTAVTDACGRDAVFVGRIREDISHPRGISLWVVADNVRKGAALNSVQIAEILVKHYL